MASKTVSRSRGRNTKSGPRSRNTAPTRRPAPRRRNQRRNQHWTTPLVALGRGARSGWHACAHGVGSLFRSVGRAHDIEHGHRRDGVALALLGLAFVVGASSWFHAAKPVGGWIDDVFRAVVGSGVALVPIIAVVIAVFLMRTEPNPEERPRLLLGFAMVALPILGLWHLFAGSPDSPEGRADAGGFVGFVIGGPLAQGLTAWIAAPLLVMAIVFGVLLLTGTTIRDIPDTLRNMFSPRDYDEWDEEWDDDLND